MRNIPSVAERLIRERLEVYGVVVDAKLAVAIERYISLLVKWNEHVNLTRVGEPEEILERHFGESMFAARCVRLEGRLADVGSGAGFPGLALKLLLPGSDVTLIESSRKKTMFLKEVCRELNLKGVRVLAERMEDVSTVVDRWDFVMSRAVGDIAGILRWSKGVMKPVGRVLLWVGLSGVDQARRVAGWSWSQPMLIPKSKQRFILVGCLVERST